MFKKGMKFLQNGICKKEQRVVGQEMQEPRQKLISYI